MSLINASRLVELEANLNSKYGETLLKTKSVMEPVVQTEQVSSYVLNDIFPLALPPMRLMKGSRNHRNISLFDNAYNNIPKLCQEFEATIDVKRYDLLADNKGVWDKQAVGLGRKVVNHLDRQASLALLNGTSTHKQYVAHDGKAIFATDHTLDPSKSQSNLMTGSLTADNFAYAMKTAKNWTDNEGQPMFIGYDEKPLLVVGPDLEVTARQIVQGPGLAANLTMPSVSSNMQYGLADVIVNPYLSVEPTSWYLLFPQAGLAPITHAQFIAPELTARFDPTDPMVFERQTFSYGLYAMTHTFLVCWWQALKSTGGGSSLYTGNNIAE